MTHLSDGHAIIAEIRQRLPFAANHRGASLILAVSTNPLLAQNNCPAYGFVASVYLFLLNTARWFYRKPF